MKQMQRSYSYKYFTLANRHLLPKTSVVMLAAALAMLIIDVSWASTVGHMEPSGNTTTAVLLEIEDEDCRDLRDGCGTMARNGLCQTNKVFMHPHCPVSCNTCDTASGRNNRLVPSAKSFGFKRPDYKEAGDMLEDVSGAELGVPQILPSIDDAGTRNSDFRLRVIQRIRDARFYMAVTVMRDSRYRSVRSLCKAHSPFCAVWAAAGECEKDPDKMEEECAPMCYTCETLHTEALCPFDPNSDNAWRPGDLDKMFHRLITEPSFQSFEPVVLSRPDKPGDSNAVQGGEIENTDYKVGPWVVTLDKFLSDDEAAKLSELGGLMGYSRSTDVGQKDENGAFTNVESQSRTSKTAWCDQDLCELDPVVIRVMERMENITNIPATNGENIQLLRYEPGQFYRTHHDFIELDEKSIEGSRILTVFLYLNDVKAGGATNFPLIDLAVQPKIGRALIWPSVLDESPHKKDNRLLHEAQVVEKGIKFGANVWFHQRDFKGPNSLGCR